MRVRRGQKSGISLVRGVVYRSLNGEKKKDIHLLRVLTDTRLGEAIPSSFNLRRVLERRIV